ncbi:MazG nucleotide pyrophosphohydrolase domain-containing protein [Streptococcus phocae]|uniref:Nucleotide pyrophosphohydrolase n=2 Tax=Streptococcus phocae TaxID=119224 RepID=A0A0P6SNJ4_9STRE|nr:nucleotide pyrophosphohydrolase [Streptococcus phocae]
MMEVTVSELQDYLFNHYHKKAIDEGLFIKLVEEVGEVAEVLNKKAKRKETISEDLESQLGSEIADVLHYAIAIAALNDINLSEAILKKDKLAAQKYHHQMNLEQFILEKRDSMPTVVSDEKLEK